jgi:hypothetical protein
VQRPCRDLTNQYGGRSGRGGSLREFYGFDSFCDHSCDPNTHTPTYRPATGPADRPIFAPLARRPIRRGERITCDYAATTTHPDGLVFSCACGAPCCRGRVLE